MCRIMMKYDRHGEHSAYHEWQAKAIGVAMYNDEHASHHSHSSVFSQWISAKVECARLLSSSSLFP